MLQSFKEAMQHVEQLDDVQNVPTEQADFAPATSVLDRNIRIAISLGAFVGRAPSRAIRR